MKAAPAIGLLAAAIAPAATAAPLPPLRGSSSSAVDNSRRRRRRQIVNVLRPPSSSWSRTRCGHPSGGADIPTRWSNEANASSTPLPLYPRPGMVRFGPGIDYGDAGWRGAVGAEGEEEATAAAAAERRRLRDHGDPGTWINLNGLWEWEEAEAAAAAAAAEEEESDRGCGGAAWNNREEVPPPPSNPPFNRTLGGSILVPFPVESCLSGNAPNRSADVVTRMWYRLRFNYSSEAQMEAAASEGEAGDDAAGGGGGRTILHFGAVDWLTYVYVNGRLVGNHTGGYDGFSFDVTSHLNERRRDNELLVFVYDPSDLGPQPSGKQHTSAVDSCGGILYTPSTGIWQTVWLENVPETYVADVKVNQASTERVAVTVALGGTEKDGASLRVEVMDGSGVVATAGGSPGEEIAIPVPNAELWSPERPFLYDMRVALLHAEGPFVGDDGSEGSSAPLDVVMTYFGLRTFDLGPADAAGRRPTLNGRPVFLAGVLDQSFWPDGLYTAPTDEALAFDVDLVPRLGLNLIRLHQKINPERWYYHADRAGVVVFQDMVQKYSDAMDATVPLFIRDAEAAVKGRGNHPSVVQWIVFNEGDCWEVFKDPPYDVGGMVDLVKSLDPTRPVDTDSGGKANDLRLGDVNDVHSYPWPGDPRPSGTQYAMIGEYGGLGTFMPGREWKPGSCHAYQRCDTPLQYAVLYAGMASILDGRRDHVGAAVYTQTTDVECECDGLVNYDRSPKFKEEEEALIRTANKRLTGYPDGSSDSHSVDSAIK